MPRLKIALVTPGFSSDERDWCIPSLLDFVRCLAAQADVHVFALRYPHRLDRYPVYGATVHSLNGVGAAGWRSPWLWARAVRALAAEHRRGAFDALHAFWAYEPGPIAVWGGRQLGVPVVVSLAGGEVVGLREIASPGGLSKMLQSSARGYGLQLWPHRRALVRWALRRAQCVTAGSRYLLRLADGAAEHLALAPLGVDTDLFSPAPQPARQDALILNVASLVTVKDQAGLLTAFAEISSDFPRSRLLLAGEGTLRPALEHLARQLEIEDRVTFLGALPHDTLPDLYRSAAFCVQSSLHEAQGMAVLEAAACGTPTVGAAVGVLPELAPAEWLARPGDSGDLARVMRHSLNHVAALRETGTAMRIATERGYALGGCVEQFLECYRRAARTRRRQPGIIGRT